MPYIRFYHAVMIFSSNHYTFSVLVPLFRVTKRSNQRSPFYDVPNLNVFQPLMVLFELQAERRRLIVKSAAKHNIGVQWIIWLLMDERFDMISCFFTVCSVAFFECHIANFTI